jgi:aminoglycoside phosphotransferase (APT) family kinase protein
VTTDGPSQRSAQCVAGTLTAPARAWVERCTGDGVRRIERLTGGYSSRMLALDLDGGRRLVLRQLLLEPWRRHGADLLGREARVHGQLAGSTVIAPSTVAVDPDGRHTGDPSLLMTRLQGGIDLCRVDRPFLTALAETLLAIHRFEPADDGWPREYQSWAFDSKRVVPPWSRDDGLYREAFDRLRAGPPAYRRTFLHRDFQPGNVLWQHGRVSGVVDWVETSTGPADLDVAHCASNVATLHGAEAAWVFREEYVGAGGRLAGGADAAAYWQLLDLVGFLPAGGRESGSTAETMTATWATHGRSDLTPGLARRHREDLLARVIRG